MTGQKIYTLGTSRRSEEDFIEILLFYDIKVLIDVRRFPTSKMPVFKKEYLQDLLQASGIKYIFLGVELGGFIKGGYEAYTATREFQHGLDRLKDAASSENTVIICAEKFPWKCHRKWIARELHKTGWTVEHIIDKGKVWTPK